MIIGVGNDIVDIRRIEKTLERYGERFLDRVFTDIERQKSDGRAQRAASYAKRFAAKEACAKALGTGLRRGVYWRDMGVINLPSGRPTLWLTGGAARQLAEITPDGFEARIDLTLTDDFPLAEAIVIISGLPEKGDRRWGGSLGACDMRAPRIARGRQNGYSGPTRSRGTLRPESKSMAVSTNTRKSGWLETATIVIEALAIAMLVRTFLYQPFNIPSGSMKETLLIGDYLFVSKLSYGYSRFSFYNIVPFEGRVFAAEPKRGDVVVFKLPRDNSTDYIKRVIGLPGDEISVRHGILYINGKEVPRKRIADFVTKEDDGPPRAIPAYQETLPNGVAYTVLDSEQDGPFDNVGPYKVPEGHYFMMGDNRDNSTDSRASWGVGYVPFDNLIGRAEIIFFSAAVDEPGAFAWYKPWEWPFDIRWNRFFKLVR